MKMKILVAIVGPILIMCCKPRVPTETVEHFSTTRSSMVYPDSFTANTTSYSDMVQNEESDIELLQKRELWLSAGLRDCVKDSTIAAWLYDQTMASGRNLVSFDDLITEFPQAEEIINSADDPLGEMVSPDFANIQDEYTAFQGDNFKFSIFLTNSATATGDYKPIVMPGFEIYDDTANNIADIALGWRLDAQNNHSAINIWEEKAAEIPVPVFAIALAADIVIDSVNNSAPDTLSEPQGIIDDSFDGKLVISKLRLAYHYDNSAWNEVHLTGKHAYTPNWGSSVGGQNNVPYILKTCTGYTYTDFQIAKVHHDNVGDTLYLNTMLCRTRAAYQYTHNKHTYYNTYERDWFAPDYSVGFASWWNVIVQLWGKMSLPSQWYSKSLNDFYYSRTDVVAIFDGSAYPGRVYKSTNSKGVMTEVKYKYCNQ